MLHRYHTFLVVSVILLKLTHSGVYSGNIFKTHESEQELMEDEDEAFEHRLSKMDKKSLDENMQETYIGSRPNILLILADDVGTGDIPFYWNSSLVEMPNIGRLHDEGITFLNAHATSLCAPSRYMLLSGNYQHRGSNAGGVWNLNGQESQFTKSQKSIAEVLKDSGYSTMMTGKWHIGANIPLKENGTLDKEHQLTSPSHDWSKPLIKGPHDFGFDSSYITTSGIQAKPYTFFRDGYLNTSIPEVRYWNKGLYEMAHGESVIKRPGEGDVDWDSTAYNQILVNETTRFLDEYLLEQPEKPFFVYAALGAVHGPHSPPYNYLDGKSVAGKHPTKHMDMLLEMDMVVGSLLDALDDRQLASETLVIFTSDNGGIKPPNDSFEFGHDSHGPLRGYKGEIWEGGTRVPLVVRHSGSLPAKVNRTQLVSLADIYATLSDVAGTSYPDDSAQDSWSFANYLTDVIDLSGRLRNWLPTWTYHTDTALRHGEAIRYQNLKAVRVTDSNGNKEWGLYDVENDVSESINLSKNSTYKKTKKRMFKRLRRDGPCPRSKKKSFTLKSGSLKGTTVTCDFFNVTERCNEYIEGELKCSKYCSRYNWICAN